MQRREFLTSATALGAMSAVDATFPRFTSAAVISPRAARPIIVSSSNGNWFKNGGDKNCVQLAYEKMMQGTDVLDALIAGVNIDELDPTEA